MKKKSDEKSTEVAGDKLQVAEGAPATEESGRKSGEEARLRILVGKAGLDGHDRGARIVARALRDAGMEVIYTGLHQTPEQIVTSAIQEDVDAIGISILSGAHMSIFPRILTLLKTNDAEEIVLFGGGIVPDEDVQQLIKMGVKKIFTPGPGSSTQDIVSWLHENLKAS